MLNRVTIMGRLVADPELKTLESGVQVCNFRIACDEDYTSKGGERETNFVIVKAWNGLASVVNKRFSKGHTIVVDGRLHCYSYMAKDGSKRYVAEIIAENVYYGDPKPKDVEKKPEVAAYFGGDKPAAPVAPTSFAGDKPAAPVEPASLGGDKPAASVEPASGSQSYDGGYPF